MKRYAVMLLAFSLAAWAQIQIKPIGPKPAVQPLVKPQLSQKAPFQKVDLNKPQTVILRSIIPNTGQGELMSMLKDGSTLYIGGEHGLRIVDVSDPKNPQQIHFSILPHFTKCKKIAKLGENKLLLWREGDKTDFAYKGIRYPGQGSEVFTVLDVSDKKKPLVTVQKDYYLFDEETTCNKDRLEYYNHKEISEKHYKTYLMPPEELGRKIGRTVLNDGFFGYRRTLAVKGDDIYLCGTFGVARFQHTYENLKGEGGSIATDAIKFKRFVTFYQLLDRYDDNEYYKKYHCRWHDNFGYSRSYMTVGNRHVITTYIIFNRDLNPVQNWKRSCDTYTCMMGVSMDEGELTYLFEIKRDNKFRLVTYKMNRYGALTQIKSYEPELFRKYRDRLSYYKYENEGLLLKRVGDYLFLTLDIDETDSGKNLKIEMIHIEPDKSLKSVRMLHIGPHKVVDVDYEEPYLYVLSPDAVRIYELKPKND